MKNILVVVLMLFGFAIPSIVLPNSTNCGAYSSCSAKPTEVQILKDLVGQVISDPSSDSYFPSDWSWTIKSKDIAYLTFLHERNESSYYVALVTIHLKRYQMPVDVKVVLTYLKNNGWYLNDLTIQSLTFPSQRSYKSCVKIYMDYDFFPSLVVENTCNYRLFVAGSYSNEGREERFAVELEPYEKSTIAIGSEPDRYAIHFAYME